jgi:hypothetical protein
MSLGRFFIMTFQFDGKSSGTTPKTPPFVKLQDDNKDWNPKVEDVVISSREVNIGTAVSRYNNDRPDPVTDLKARLSSWGKLIKAAPQQLLTIHRSKLSRRQERVVHPRQLNLRRR